MSTPTPCRWATPNTTSRWPTGSRSKAQGSRPPTRSAPARTAASSSSAVPGSRRIPDCGNATTCTSARAACASRAASTPSRRSRPLSVSTWAWLRTAVAPEAITAASVRVARSSTEPPAVRQFWRSLRISPASPGSAVWGRNGRPRRVESRWAWTSAKAGSSTPPRPSATATPAGAGPLAMRPSRITTSTVPAPGSRGHGRTSRSSRSPTSGVFRPPPVRRKMVRRPAAHCQTIGDPMTRASWPAGGDDAGSGARLQPWGDSMSRDQRAHRR